jgi:hypothetical protein
VKGLACPECGSVLGLALVDLFELQQHADLFGVELFLDPSCVDPLTYWWCHRCHNGGALHALPGEAGRRGPGEGARGGATEWQPRARSGRRRRHTGSA